MYVHVQVVTGSRRERVTKASETKFHIEVREPRERNLANKRIREILAQEFGVTLPQVLMLTGHRSSSKMYSVELQ